MSRFLTKLCVELIDDAGTAGRGTWQVTANFVYESTVAKRMIRVPAGFLTDFASVPRLPVAYWLTGDTAHSAAVIHDYLYSTADMPRALADQVLFEAMELEGVPAWRRWAIYYPVRMFGGSHYGNR